MSRILRRPMFRGGRVDSRGTGITSGLNYAKGGSVNTPKRGLVDGPGGYAGYKFGETGFGKVLGGIGAVRPAFYDLFNTIANKGSEFFTGYNPGLSYNKMLRAERDLKDKMMGKDPLKRTDRMTDDEVDYTNFLFMEPSAKKGWTTPSMQPEPVTGIKGPPGGGDPEMKYDAPEEKEKSLEELMKDLMGPKKTAKEKVAEYKEIFKDAYGSGVADDASAMALSFAKNALAPDATVKSAFAGFFDDESKRPSESKKYKDAATTAAINAYLTGEKDYDSLMKQMKIIDYQIDKKSDAAKAAKSNLSFAEIKAGLPGTLKDREKTKTAAELFIEYTDPGKSLTVIEADEETPELLQAPENEGLYFMNRDTKQVFKIVEGIKQIIYGG
jgi:hypothetical protein